MLSAWAAMREFLALAWVPAIAPVKDVGLAGQFRFLRKPGPWLILGAVFTGNAGVFCWWSYVSPWLQKTGGYDSDMVPFLMMLAGFGMVVGGIIGGRITDNWRHAGTAALGQALSGVAIFTFWIAFGLFFISAPQQLLMTESGKGGGELLAGAAVQVAFNFGNAVGSMVGGGMLNLSGMNYHFTALGGVPLAVIAVALLTIYSMRHETHTDALERMREITV